MSSAYGFRANGDIEGSKRIQTLITNIVAGNATEDLTSVLGSESMSLDDTKIAESYSYAQRQNGSNALKAMLKSDEAFQNRAKALSQSLNIEKHTGVESFSLAMSTGAVARQKAATIELNIKANTQFKAAEAMYPTITVGYDENTIELPIDVAGVGTYNFGGNGHESYENMRPITSILSDSTFETGDDLKLVPVYQDGTDNPDSVFFVKDSVWAKEPVTYDENDLLGRDPHDTNYLRPITIPNLMNICRAPGTTKWENNDEIEPSSIRLASILFKLKVDGKEEYVTLDTSRAAGNGMRPVSGESSVSKRRLTMISQGEATSHFMTKDNKPTELFASLGEDIKIGLKFKVEATFHRDTRAFEPTVSKEVSIGWVSYKGNQFKPNTSKVPKEVADVLASLEFEGSIEGLKLTMNHNNVNRSRYGITVTYANVMKPYTTNKRSPISVKYPMTNDDTNTEILNKCIKQMGTIITRNKSHEAFKEASKHFDRLYAENGMKVVSFHDDSNATPPGQYFLKTVAIESKLRLQDEVSTLDSKDTLVNIQSVLVNRVNDVINALRQRSDFAALKEVDTRTEKYTIIAHTSLAPFLMTKGDVRTFGQTIEFEVIENNIDVEAGRIWIFPTGETRDGSIDVFGGMGFCLDRELLVIEGDVRMASRQYRMMITEPSYQHYSVSCVVGRVTIEDIDDLLSDDGLISKINRHIVGGSIEGVNGGGNGTKPGDEINITPGE